MNTIAQDLASIQAFSELPALDLVSGGAAWRQRELAVSEPLWEEGDAADGLAVLVSGELQVERQGVTVGKVQAGEIIGEASAFLKAHVRTVTLRAASPSRVLLLSGEKLQAMRGTGSAMYDTLLELAQHALVRRVRATNQRIAMSVNGGGPDAAREERSALVRLWNALRQDEPSTPCPPIEPLLRVQPGLGGVDESTIAAIARGFTAVPYAAGTILFLEGEPGTDAWLVAQGEVDVIHNVRDGKAERLAKLGPARLLGVNALIERGPRAASCVTATPCWLYRMDGAQGYAHLHGAQRTAWRESLVGSLTSQIRNADDALEASNPAAAATPNDDARFEEILLASGWTPGPLSVGLSELETIVTEEASRGQRTYSVQRRTPSGE